MYPLTINNTNDINNTNEAMTSEGVETPNNGNFLENMEISDSLKRQLDGLKKQGISIHLSKNADMDTVDRMLKQHRNLSKVQQLEKKATQQQQNIAQQQWQVVKNNTHNKKTVKNNKRKKTASLSTSDESEMDYEVDKNNRFAALQNLEIIKTEQAANSANNSANITAMQNENEKEKVQHNMTRANFSGYCPPIIMYNVAISDLVKNIKINFPDLELKVINSSKTKSKLFLKDAQAHEEIMKLLKEKNVNSHSFTLPQNKQLSIILRGLHHLSVPDEIKAELDERLPNTVSSVQPFLTPYMKKNNLLSDLFLVTLLPGKSFSDIGDVKYLAYQKIKWEKPHSFAKEVQCKRCQRWGHVAKNCNHAFRCVKCDKTHEPDQCQLEKKEDTEPYCINCKKWGHPANYRGCKALKSFSTSKKINTQNKPNRITLPAGNSFVDSNKSYASHFHNHKKLNASKSANSGIFGEFYKIAKELFGAEQVSIEVRIQSFLENFKLMSVETRKTECLKLLQELQNYDE